MRELLDTQLFSAHILGLVSVWLSGESLDDQPPAPPAAAMAHDRHARGRLAESGEGAAERRAAEVAERRKERARVREKEREKERERERAELKARVATLAAEKEALVRELAQVGRQLHVWGRMGGWGGACK